MAPRTRILSWSSLCNYLDKIIFVMGGRCGGRYSPPETTVESYNLRLDTWMEMPSLKVARAGASSCQLASHVYIFCGMKEKRIRLNSVERLRVIALEPRLLVEDSWQLIQLKEEMLASRSNPSVLPFNNSQIAILGGLRQKDEAYMGDVLLFDVRSKVCTTLIPDMPRKAKKARNSSSESETSSEQSDNDDDAGNQLKFSSAANQSALVGQDWLVSLVNTASVKGETCPALIGYKRGASAVQTLRTFPKSEDHDPNAATDDEI